MADFYQFLADNQIDLINLVIGQELIKICHRSILLL